MYFENGDTKIQEEHSNQIQAQQQQHIWCECTENSNELKKSRPDKTIHERKERKKKSMVKYHLKMKFALVFIVI